MLEAIVHDLTSSRPATGLCAGFELKEWRAKLLADYLIESLPDFCLTYSEYRRIDHESAVALIRQAARTVYQTGKFQKRGEFGELLLHVVLKSVMNTLPAVSKIYYKDAANDTVKGFDAVHVVAGDKGLELWLGEVKFYEEIGAAIRDVSKELEVHLAADYLKSEFLAIVNKIDDAWAHSDELKRLLDEKTSLDQVFKAFCIPVLLTYDGDTTGKFDQATDAYKQELAEEFFSIRKRFEEKNVAIPHRIHLFLVPLKTKKALISFLDEKLKTWQNI
jgi:hypothetical protein